MDEGAAGDVVAGGGGAALGVAVQARAAPKQNKSSTVPVAVPGLVNEPLKLRRPLMPAESG